MGAIFSCIKQNKEEKEATVSDEDSYMSVQDSNFGEDNNLTRQEVNQVVHNMANYSKEDSSSLDPEYVKMVEQVKLEQAEKQRKKQELEEKQELEKVKAQGKNTVKHEENVKVERTEIEAKKQSQQEEQRQREEQNVVITSNEDNYISVHSYDSEENSTSTVIHTKKQKQLNDEYSSIRSSISDSKWKGLLETSQSQEIE